MDLNRVFSVLFFKIECSAFLSQNMDHPHNHLRPQCAVCRDLFDKLLRESVTFRMMQREVDLMHRMVYNPIPFCVPSPLMPLPLPLTAPPVPVPIPPPQVPQVQPQQVPQVQPQLGRVVSPIQLDSSGSAPGSPVDPVRSRPPLGRGRGMRVPRS